MAGDKPKKVRRYKEIIQKIFHSHYEKGKIEVPFERSEIEKIGTELGIGMTPKNLGDLIYTFRHHRAELPDSIKKCVPKGHEWVILGVARSRYAFVAIPSTPIVPNPNLSQTKIPDATPGIIMRYALSDEQALLAKLRYNRLIDIFSGVTCYPLQSHLRTQIITGQMETDEVYIGVDQRGVHYVFPVQAKGSREKMSIVQIIQDFVMCEEKFPLLVCRAIGAQFIQPDLIALFGFEKKKGALPKIALEKHYHLVPSSKLSDDEIKEYRNLSFETKLLG
ncbi:endonuclease [bacterium]|nr:endonuclease [bacterium]